MQFRPQYQNMGSFTVVVTPHFQERAIERNHRFDANFLSGQIPKLYERAELDQCYAVECGESFVYFRVQYNEFRRRYEFELISVTPNDLLHTEERKFAQLMEV